MHIEGVKIKTFKVVSMNKVETVVLEEGVSVRRLVTKEDSDKLMLGICFLDPGAESEPWTYATEDEVFYVLRGEIAMLCGGKKIEAKEGDAIYLPAGEEHKLMNKGTQPAMIVYATSPPLK